MSFSPFLSPSLFLICISYSPASILLGFLLSRQTPLCTGSLLWQVFISFSGAGFTVLENHWIWMLGTELGSSERCFFQMLSHLSRPKHVVFNTCFLIHSYVLSVRFWCSFCSEIFLSDRRAMLHTWPPFLGHSLYFRRTYPMTVPRMECMSENYYYTYNSDW